MGLPNVVVMLYQDHAVMGCCEIPSITNKPMLLLMNDQSTVGKTLYP